MLYLGTRTIFSLWRRPAWKILRWRCQQVKTEQSLCVCRCPLRGIYRRSVRNKKGWDTMEIIASEWFTAQNGRIPPPPLGLCWIWELILTTAAVNTLPCAQLRVQVAVSVMLWIAFMPFPCASHHWDKVGKLSQTVFHESVIAVSLPRMVKFDLFPWLRTLSRWGLVHKSWQV